MIVKWMQSTHRDLDRTERGENRYISAPSLTCCPKSTDLRELWRRLDNNLIDTNTFLAVASNLIDPIVQDILFNGLTLYSDFSLVKLVDLNENPPEISYNENNVLNEILLENLPRQNEIRHGLNASSLTTLLFLAQYCHSSYSFNTLTLLFLLNPENQENNECVASSSNRIEYIMQPCGHKVYCWNCLEILEALAELDEQALVCPICRAVPQHIDRLN
ncbi:uncharacterized protein [Chelonus insularis]|uniref:uncharacterized protein n=1 Tax=Chelonus insularis TaxID=460826 RepID=UPI00158B6606|nr:uncharacterized protein LOC118073086 [Chelonus insularis]